MDKSGICHANVCMHVVVDHESNSFFCVKSWHGFHLEAKWARDAPRVVPPQDWQVVPPKAGQVVPPKAGYGTPHPKAMPRSAAPPPEAMPETYAQGKLYNLQVVYTYIYIYIPKCLRINQNVNTMETQRSIYNDM